MPTPTHPNQPTPSFDPLQQRGFNPIRMEADCNRLALSGKWPAELAGTLYRIGPNPQFEPRGTYNPFLGDGMVHAFEVADGHVSYRNRWVRTTQWTMERAAGHALFGTSGDPRDHDPSVAGMPTDGVANTHIVWHADRLLCLEEGHLPIEIEPRSLDTRGVWQTGGGPQRNFTAHPKVDPVTGQLFAFANYPAGKFNGTIDYFVFDAAGNVEIAQTIQAPYAGLVHDFTITEHYIVFIICPATISVPRAMTGGPALAWEPDLPTYVGVVPRAPIGTSSAAGVDSYGRSTAVPVQDIQWFSRKSCFVRHIANSWDEGNALTIDVCEQAAPLFPLLDGSMPAPEQNAQLLTRWRIDLSGAQPVAVHHLAPGICEYPRIDERYVGRPNRFTYLASHGGLGSADMFHRGITRYDNDSGDTAHWHFGDDQAASEPVFVPRADDSPEGDGYLLVVVYDEARDRSRLVVLDALEVAAGPIAQAFLEHRVPMGFHGSWRPRQPNA